MKVIEEEYCCFYKLFNDLLPTGAFGEMFAGYDTVDEMTVISPCSKWLFRGEATN